MFARFPRPRLSEKRWWELFSPRRCAKSSAETAFPRCAPTTITTSAAWRNERPRALANADYISLIAWSLVTSDVYRVDRFHGNREECRWQGPCASAIRQVDRYRHGN